jgi:hypothetical protein
MHAHAALQIVPKNATDAGEFALGTRFFAAVCGPNGNARNVFTL